MTLAGDVTEAFLQRISLADGVLAGLDAMAVPGPSTVPSWTWSRRPVRAGRGPIYRRCDFEIREYDGDDPEAKELGAAQRREEEERNCMRRCDTTLKLDIAGDSDTRVLLPTTWTARYLSSAPDELTGSPSYVLHAEPSLLGDEWVILVKGAPRTVRTPADPRRKTPVRSDRHDDI